MGARDLIEATSPSLEATRPALCKAAQEVYDAWDASGEDGDPDVGFGGICQDIADAMSSVLSDAGFEAGTVDNNGVGEQHVWCIVRMPDGVAEVDIAPNLYERGGGYNWTKIPGVTFEPGDIGIGYISRDPDDFDAMLENY